MLFRRRTTQPEHFDDPSRTFHEFREAYDQLARVNQLFRAHDPYTRVLSRWLGHEQCRKLTILDIGAGDGWLGQAMETFAREQGWEWQVTNVDLNAIPLSLHNRRRHVAGSALALPFADGAFDVVVASQMTHHLNTDEEVIRHFQEAWRVARTAVFLTDMQRGAFLFCVLSLVMPFLGLSRKMMGDGLLSVRKGWVPREWRSLADRAGIQEMRVSGYYGVRVILSALKNPVSNVEAIETSELYLAEDQFYSSRSGK
jgi:ubiquinone/menaquinone biosynthesis C-methylase UbiE